MGNKYMTVPPTEKQKHVRFWEGDNLILLIKEIEKEYPYWEYVDLIWDANYTINFFVLRGKHY